jgi:hypothetical protein
MSRLKSQKVEIMSNFEELVEGLEVHYYQPDGAHSKAVITHVYNQGVVDLEVTWDDGTDTYVRKTVVFSQEPKPYTWHRIETS